MQATEEELDMLDLVNVHTSPNTHLLGSDPSPTSFITAGRRARGQLTARMPSEDDSGTGRNEGGCA